ncbi:PxKF domain-containing protein [Thioflavicoccus mobilis]|uniref:PxKF domain-containing protein n=1 Tax=Thioflavicoccus mobilis TaxID=80679 RepID=UPI001C0F5369|nr:PxKF domain-containing protein [Thioflavicoccus mobilis]
MRPDRASAVFVHIHFREQIMNALKRQFFVPSWWRGNRGIASILVLIAALMASAGTLAASQWTFQGPGPITAGQQWVPEPATNPVTGSVNAIAASPNDPDLLYIGGANGGIWKTTNATNPSPSWTPLSDELESQSIAAMALDPTDSTGQTLIAATGRYSGLASLGDDQVGIYYTTDGGVTWTNSRGTGDNLVYDSARYWGYLTDVAASGDTLLAAMRSWDYLRGGIFRSTDGPTGTWTHLSNGLPDGSAGFVIIDPADPNVLYAGFLGASGGVYKSTDGGDTWTDITNGIPRTTADSTGFGISALTKAMGAAVFNDGTTSVLTVALAGTFGNSSSSTTGYAVYRSVNGGPFTAQDYPAGLRPFSGHFPIAADRIDPNLVYLAGYGFNGGDGYLFRLDASQPSGSQATPLAQRPRVDVSPAISATKTAFYVWSVSGLPTETPFTIRVDQEEMQVNQVNGYQTSGGTPYWYFYVTRGINGTTATAHARGAPIWPIPLSGNLYGAPHADYTDLTVDANGALLAGNHGGIYRLPEPASPASAANLWTALNSDQTVTEIHDIAYDHVSGTLVATMQDLGAAIQNAPDDRVWTSVRGGDGGDVAVVDIGGGQSIRYVSSQDLSGLARDVYDASNTLVGSTKISTSVITDKKSITPVVANAVDPNRLAFGGGNRVYESKDQGATIAALPDPVGVNYYYPYPGSNFKGPMVYGGRLNGLPNPDLLYVGYYDKVYVRTQAGGAFAETAQLPSGAGNVQSIAVDPDDYYRVFATDNDHVFMSDDGGASWSDITGDIGTTQLTALVYVPGPAPYLAVGSRAGVLASPLSSLGTWTSLKDFPSFVVFDLAYDATDDVLAVGCFGSGAYLLTNASAALSSTTTAVLPADETSGGDRTDGALAEVWSWIGGIGAQVLSAVIPSAEAGELTQPPGLVSWWRANGDATDDHDGNDGTLENGATFGAGQYGQAFSLDGVDDYVNVPDAPNLDLTTNFTIDAWVYPNSNTVGRVVGKGRTSVGTGYALGTDSSGNAQVSLHDGSVGCSAADIQPLAVGQWSHIAGTFAGTELKIYVNGTLQATETCSFSSIGPSTEPLNIGREAAGIGRYFDGSVDEVHVYDRALTAAEVHAIYTYTQAVLMQVDLQESGASNQQTQAGWDAQELPHDPDGVGSFSLLLTSAGSTAGITATLGGDSDGWEARGPGQSSARGQISGTSLDDLLEDFVLTRDEDASVSLTGLVVGDEYLFQAWNNDSYTVNTGFAAGAGTVTPSVTGGIVQSSSNGTITNLYGTQTDSAFGATSLRFTATSSSATIDLDGNNPNGYLPINGIRFSQVTSVAPTAAVTGPASALEGQVIEVVLTATDLSPANQAVGFTYVIDWDDGSPIQTVDPVAGTGAATARHAFADVGTYEVQVTATNQDGVISDQADNPIQVEVLTPGSLQDQLDALSLVTFQPIDDTALQGEVGAVNALAGQASPMDVTIVLGAGPFGPVVLSPPENVYLNLAGNYTADSLVESGGSTEAPPEIELAADATLIDGEASGPAVTVTRGETYVQGDALTTAAGAPTVLVTGGRLTLSQGNIQESTGADSVAIEVAGSGKVELGFDMVLNVNGEGTFIRSPDREAVEPPKGIDAELNPNLFSRNGAPVNAIALSSTRIASSVSPSTFGEPVTFTATIDVEVEEGGVPTGTVSFYDGASLLGSSVVQPVGYGYQASFATAALEAGDHDVSAVYGGDDRYISSRSAVLVQSVDAYAFTGFFRPVDNPPTMNRAKGGSSIPVKFSLGGDRGLDILAGYPTSQPISCDDNTPVDDIEEEATSKSGLKYDPDSDQYIYVWKTLKGWSSTCRQLTVRLADGTAYTALFSFK